MDHKPVIQVGPTQITRDSDISVTLCDACYLLQWRLSIGVQSLEPYLCAKATIMQSTLT